MSRTQFGVATERPATENRLNVRKDVDMCGSLLVYDGPRKRAIYDAHETEALFLHAEFSTFQSDYRMDSISIVVPGFSDMLAAFDEFTNFIRETDRESRETYYEALEEKVKRMRSISKVLPAHRDSLNKLRQDREDERVRSTKALKWAIIALVVTGVIALVGIYRDEVRDSDPSKVGIPKTNTSP